MSGPAKKSNMKDSLPDVAEVAHEHIASNGVQLHIAVAGPPDGPPVVLCHGFPEIWYSWRHQLHALGNAGYRVIAPDLRGYGATTCPDQVTAYGSDEVTADLCGLLDHFGYEKATFSGHDWGSIMVWEMGKLHPDRVASIFNISVPYHETPAAPIETLEAISGGNFLYSLYFQDVGPAESELQEDPRGFLRTLMYATSAEGMANGTRLITDTPREGTKFLDVLPQPPTALPAWLTEEDLDVFADAFGSSGFFGPLSYYRNMDANWKRSKDIGASTFSMPTGFLVGALDPVYTVRVGAIDAMSSLLPDFRGVTRIEGAGHWVPQEKPHETNAALLAFLAAVA